MSNTITINVLGNTRGFQQSLQGVQNDLGRLGAASQKAGTFLKNSLKVAGVGALAAGVAVAKFGADSVKAASDLNETISKTKTIFGQASPEIMKFANTAATAIGMSKQEALDGASTFGNFFDQIGIGKDKSVEMSKAWVTMAADLGSFHNAAPVEVMEALSSATRGEYDSLQKFIPTINAAAVEQKALAMTGKDSADALTAAEKASATYALTLKGQGKAAGDFGRTSGSLANQQKILASQFENVKAKIGTALLPVMTSLVTLANQHLVPALKDFAKWFEAEGPAAIEKMVAKFNEFLPTIKKVGTFLIENAGTIAKMVAAFYALTTIIAVVGPIIQGITAAFKAYKAIATAVKAVQLALNILWMANPIGLVVVAIAALVAIFVVAYKKSETFRNIIDKSWAAIKKATVTVWEAVKDAIKKVFDFLKTLFLNFTGPGLIIKHWDKIKSATKAAWDFVKNAVKVVWDWLKGAVSTVFNAVKNGVVNAWDSIKSKTSAAWDAVKNLVKNAWDNMKNNVQNGVNAVINFVKGLPGKIKGFFSGAASWLISAGKNIIQGLLDGISGMIGTVKNKLGELTDMIPDWKGPAQKDKKLLRPVGKMIMEGLVKGFDDGREGIEKSLGKITDLISKEMDKRFKSDKKAEEATKAAIKNLKDEAQAMMNNARARENMADRMEKAQERLNAIRKEAADYAKSIQSGVIDTGSIGNLGKDEEGNVSIGGILGDLRKKVTDAKTYKSVLDSLIKMGLNKTTLDQLAQMGVEGGLATAQAIVSGGKEAIAEVNYLTKQLQATGKSMGDTLAKEMYGAGIQAAQGVVKGLRVKQRELVSEARTLARELVKAFREEMDLGLNAEAVKVKKETLKSTGSSRGGDNVTINVKVSPTADKAAIGKEIQKTLDEYHRKGGTRR